MESGILMIVIVVMGIFYPAYTAWISLVEAPVYLKIGFLFTMSGALLVMRILRKEKQIKWMVLLGILGVYAWSLYSWYDEECHYQYARSVHGDSGNALMLFVGTFTCLIPLFLLDAELTWWMESRKKKKEESLIWECGGEKRKPPGSRNEKLVWKASPDSLYAAYLCDGLWTSHGSAISV